MPIHLYIEHLLNIRTLSIQASLPTSSTERTRASISADKSILTLGHNDEIASIKLPINLSPTKESKISLDLPPVPQKELSFRVQLEEKEGSELTSGLDREAGIVIPWTSDQLTAETEVCCKACGAIVVERGKIKLWKDLPSEGWAEMMDFWHCHKPDHPDGQHAHAGGELKKGYAANSRLAIDTGVGMVDAMSFVLVADDCSGVEHREQSSASDLSCAKDTCSAALGTADLTTEQGYKLHKPALSLSCQPSTPHVSYNASKWLSLRILTAVESQGVRKFTISVPAAPDQSALQVKLWVFTPDLLVSTSALESNEPLRVAKILWQEVDAVESDVDGLAEKLSRQALSEGELSLREDDQRAMLRLLKESASWLPANARKFGEWNVGLLEQFSKADLQS